MLQKYKHVNECKAEIIKFMRGTIEIYGAVSLLAFPKKRSKKQNTLKTRQSAAKK